MNPAEIIAAIEGVLKIVADLEPSVAKGIGALLPFAEAIYNNLVNKTDITQAQLDALEAAVDDAAAQLQEPLPDDPDNSTET